MPRGDVADFMAEHTRELGFGIEVYEQSAIHIDIAAAGGERIDAFVVDDEEFEFLVGQVARQRQALADDVHVFLHGLVVVEAQRLDDFLVMLLGGFLFTSHEPITTFLPPVAGLLAHPAANTQVAAMKRGNSRMRFI